MPRSIALIALLTTAGCIGAATMKSPPETQLPPEALREKARLESLFEVVAETYPCEVKDQVNEMIPRVHSVTFAENLGDVSGEMRIPIPPAVVRVWKLFTTLNFHGSGLGKPGQAIHFETPHGDKPHFGYWRKGDVFLSGHSTKLAPTDDTYEGYSIVVKGQGSIDRVVLLHREGVSAKFDDNPWSTLGKDKPVKRVRVTVDATHRRAIGGSVRLERERFWRIPSHYGTHPGGMVAARYAAERGFYPGRGIWKLDGMTRWGYGGVKLREDPDNPGRPVYSDFDSVEFDAEADQVLQTIAPHSLKLANCFDNWPPFMALKGTRIKNHRGTPADFDEAAKLASAAIRWQKKVRKNHDYWWEVKNESTITEEWVLHAEEGVDSWGELARFHNIMADTIHAEHGDSVVVGGPTSAWMALHHGDFGLARKQMRFMDETKGHLDFYSHHFYEGKQLILSEGDSYSGGYLMGRLEGCLDLLRNHMELTGNVKPMIISETGTLYGRDNEIGIWLNSKNLNSYLMRYIEYPDRIDLVSLWLIPYSWWDKGKRLFYKDDSGKLARQDKVGYFLEQWKDFRGDRLPYTLDTARTDVHLHSVIDGNTVWVAVNNLNPYRVAVDLRLLAGDVGVERIEQIRHYFDRGEIHFETLERGSLKALPVAVEETTLVKITLSHAPGLRGILNERTWYGNKVLQPTGEPVAFEVRAPAGDVQHARLRVCLSRNGGFGEKLSVRFNGKRIARSVSITPVRKSGNYWGYHTVEVPAKLVRAENELSIVVPESGGYVTSVALVTSELQARCPE